MKAVLKKVSKALLVVPALVMGLAFLVPSVAHAQLDCSDVSSGGISKGAQCAAPKNAPAKLFGDGSIFSTITSILLFVIGAIAVIMLIVGGIKYVVSQGDQNAITSAKNTILYALIGIVVAFLAYAAVGFVTDQLNKGTNSTDTTTYRISSRQV